MKSNSVHTQELIDRIIKIQLNKAPLRKATAYDLFSTNNKSKILPENKNSNDKIKSFRKQEEFGPKKRIKP